MEMYNIFYKFPIYNRFAERYVINVSVMNRFPTLPTHLWTRNMITILSSTNVLLSLCLYVLIPYRDLAYAYPQRISSRSGAYGCLYKSTRLTINIADYTAANKKNRAGLDTPAWHGRTPLRIVQRFIGIYISRTVTPTL